MFEVSIGDNGKGIPDKRKEELLDPDRRFGGIGIHQSKSIVVKYGRRISIHDRVQYDSTQGVGFRVWFPRRDWVLTIAKLISNLILEPHLQ